MTTKLSKRHAISAIGAGLTGSLLRSDSSLILGQQAVSTPDYSLQQLHTLIALNFCRNKARGQFPIIGT